MCNDEHDQPQDGVLGYTKKEVEKFRFYTIYYHRLVMIRTIAVQPRECSEFDTIRVKKPRQKSLVQKVKSKCDMKIYS